MRSNPSCTLWGSLQPLGLASSRNLAAFISLHQRHLTPPCHNPRLQSVVMSAGEVSEVSAYTCAGRPLPADIESAMHWLLNEPLTAAMESEYGGLVVCGEGEGGWGWKALRMATWDGPHGMQRG